MAEGGPIEVLEMAMEQPSVAGELPLLSNEDLDSQVKNAVIPAAVRSALIELVERERSQESSNVRVVKRRLEMSEGSVIRISGYCGGQEFSFWISPRTNRIIAEKDPLSAFGTSAATSAEEARDAGDWKRALSLARESLAYSPAQPGARGLIRAWRWKVTGEALLAGLMGGLMAAMTHAIWISRFEKGLNKTGALLHAAGGSLFLGFVTALVLIPILLRVSQFYLRCLFLCLGIAGVLLFSAAPLRLSGGSSIRAADQASLDRELNERFKYGFPQVYYEPDLQDLKGILLKFKDTQVDLSRIKEGIALQAMLKEKLQSQQEEYEGKVREILASGESLTRKRAQLSKLAKIYRLTGVDLKSSQVALDKIEGIEIKRGTPKQSPRTSHIKIISLDSPRRTITRVESSQRPSPKKEKPKIPSKPVPKKGESKKSTLKTGSSQKWWE